MSRYDRLFRRLASKGEGAFGGFLMLGDPHPEASASLLDALVEGGSDMIEVGIPFSDPIADGHVIQAAGRRALAAGVRIGDCFDLIAGFRARHPDVPVGVLTYANLVVGRVGFMRDCAEAGADSLLIADVPASEAGPFVREMSESGIEPVLIAAANTPDETLSDIARFSRGYTYCVSRIGVTGTHQAGHFDRSLIARLKAAGSPPTVFGFGVSRPSDVRAALDAGASGVICGSAIVQLAHEAAQPTDAVIEFVGVMKAATKTQQEVG